MKITYLTSGVLFLVVSSVAIAQAKDSPYVDALAAQGSHCTSIAVKVSQDTKARPSHGTDNLGTVLACISSAKQHGINIYKRYIALENDSRIKADMKAVLIAWRVWMPEMVKGVYGINNTNQDQTGYALHKAIATLHVDKLTK